MITARTFRILALGTALALTGGAFPAHAQQGKNVVRAEVGKPVQEAQSLNKRGRFKEALAAAQPAVDAAGKTPFETMALELTLAQSYLGLKEPAKAAAAIERAVATGEMTKEDRAQRLDTMARLFYQAGDYKKSAATGQQAMAEGATNMELRGMVAQALFLEKRFKEAAEMVLPVIQDSEKRGQKPQEDFLQMRANAFHQTGDRRMLIPAMEQLIRHYPKQDYWNGLLHELTQMQGFSPELAVDAGLLRMRTGFLLKRGTFMELAQEALYIKLPNQALAVLDKGFATGALGKEGPGVDRERRLLEFARKRVEEIRALLPELEAEARAAESGDLLVALGRTYADYKDFTRGVALMDDGFRKGKLANLDHARLRLGVVLLEAGQKDRAEKILRTVKSEDGSAQLARLWLLQRAPSS
ncbi:MAG TPA: tetratricopeptide repeat protein [Azospirillaceae bacterium]|nr:tetratricopeptide repeat protein [Azospirillaceae bacterium]